MYAKFSVCVLFVVVLVLSHGQPMRARPTPRVTGTYTDMHFIKEAGDVVGDELKIAYAGGGFQGVLQIAEGEPGKLILVDIHCEGAQIDFSIPDSSPYAGTFTGIIENEILDGEFRFKSSETVRVKLPRGKSYWD
jgi:hypothetical protein